MRTYDFVYTQPEQLPEDYREQLWKFLSIQTCIEGGMADASGINPNGLNTYPMPAAKHRHFMAFKMADEGDHAYGLFQLSKGIGKDPHQLLHKVRTGEIKDRALDAFTQLDWSSSHLRFEVFAMLTEAAGGIASIAAMGSTYIPWAMWSARNYIDEGITHSLLSMNNVRERVEAGEREEAQALMDEMYPFALDLFGAANTKNEAAYLKFGIKTMTNTECRVIWMRQMRERIGITGLNFPSDPYQGSRGRYDECREGLESNWGAINKDQAA